MNLLNLLDDLGIEYRLAGSHHHATYGRASVDCPQCSPGSSRFRLGITLDGKRSHCWTCGKVDVVWSLSQLANVGRAEIADALGGVEGAEGTRAERGKLVIPRGVGPMKKAHRDYLRGRGLDPDECEALWGVKGIGQEARLAWRIWIPILTTGSRASATTAVSSWTTRAITTNCGKHIRYITAKPSEEAVSAKACLIGSSLAGSAVLVCEGPFDAMRIGPGAVATMGVSFTQAQVKELAKFPVRYIVYDADDAGQEKARELCDLLSVMPGRTTNVVLDSAKDPGDASEREIRQLRRLIQ